MRLKQIAFFIAIITALFVIHGLLSSIASLLQKKTLIVQAQQELIKEETRNHQLKSRLALVQRPEFIEQEARNKLFLVKPGEEVIVVPSLSPEASPTASPRPANTLPNWKKWWSVFF